MLIFSYSQYSKKVEGLELSTQEINNGEDLIVESMYNFPYGNNAVQLLETKEELIIISFGNEDSSSYSMDIYDIDILKDRSYKDSYDTEIKEVEISKYELDNPRIIKIKKSELLELNYENIKNRIEKIEIPKIKETILEKLEKEKEDIFDFEDRTYMSQHTLLIAESIIWLKNGVFNMFTFKYEPEALFFLNDAGVGFTTNDIIILGEKYPLNETSEFIFGSYNEDETLEDIPLKDLGYFEISIRKFDNNHYLGYRNHCFAKDYDYLTFFYRDDNKEFDYTNREIRIVEENDIIEIFVQERYGKEYNIVFKKDLNSKGETLTINNKTFEYNCNIKDKIINDWNSCVFDIVLLEDGKLWLYQKGWDEIVDEILLEENCESFDFIRDFNNISTILKTNTHIYYWPRLDGEIEDDKKGSDYIYKEELSEELKGNTYIKVPFEKKYSKTNKLWTLKYLNPVEVKLDSNGKPYLENMTEDYLLFSPYEGKAKLSLEGKEYLFILEQKNKGTINYQGDDIFNAQRVKRWPGMEKIIVKTSSDKSNYVLFKSKGKKRVYVFIKNVDENNEYDIGQGEYYIEEGNFSFYGGNEFCGEGFTFFNDKKLPDIMQIEDGSGRRQQIRGTYLKENNKYEDIITSEEPYDTPKIKKGSF